MTSMKSASGAHYCVGAYICVDAHYCVFILLLSVNRDCRFSYLISVFQSYWQVGRVKMKCCANKVQEESKISRDTCLDKQCGARLHTLMLWLAYASVGHLL